MTRRAIVVSVVAVALLGSCWLAYGRYGNARERLTAAQTQLAAAQRDVAEIVALRSQEQHIADRKRPEKDVIARVSDTLARAGLPPGALASLNPESDAVLPGNAAYRRQTLRLSLRNLDLPGVGAFLSAWRESQLVWTITQIDLTHSRQRDCEACFDVSLLLSAIYVQGGDA
jgi:hypothetical protein